MASIILVAAVVVAHVALLVSYLAWRASALAVRAATFDRRYNIYEDAERFIEAWIRDSRPDMSTLSTLVGAWSRSHFLCNEQVTQYLRKLWLDAVRADHLQNVVSGKAAGDRAQAANEASALLREHVEFEDLRATFMPDLKVQPHLLGHKMAQRLSAKFKAAHPRS